MHLTRLNRLMRDGWSLSGHERNCAFLNIRNGQFATVSAVCGVDFFDDARSPAVVDWDQDGDLDLWVANRSAPMVRLLRNTCQQSNRSLALRLVGVDCNRDGIGARVDIKLTGDHPPLHKTLHAGEGFLSQSSKWLHFGLGESDSIEKVTIHWPGGEPQIITGIQSGGRYQITQGNSTPVTVAPVGNSSSLTAAELPTVSVGTASRTVLSSRFPLPQLSYLDRNGKSQVIKGKGQPILINLWASWCAPCIVELKEWTEHKQVLDRSGLKIYALSIDDLDTIDENTTKTAYAQLQKIDFPYHYGACTEELRQRLEEVYYWPFGRKFDMPSPTSFLLDGQGRIAGIYRGRIEFSQLIKDLDLLQLEGDALLDAALPFPGRWHSRPAPLAPVQVASLLVEQGDVEEAADYIRANRSLLETSPGYSLLAVWVGEKYSKSGDTKQAIYFFNEAARTTTSDYRVFNNLAWMLATAQGVSRQNIGQAVTWAEKAVHLTRRQNPTTLDTLAVCYATAGRYTDATRTIDEAIRLASQSGNTALVSKLRRARQLYSARKTYIPPPK